MYSRMGSNVIKNFLIILIIHVIESTYIELQCDMRREKIKMIRDGIYFGKILIWKDRMECISEIVLNGTKRYVKWQIS